jgi:hypothetical protein
VDAARLSTRRNPDRDVPSELAEILNEIGGRREDRTRDLRIANAALSQLS